MSRESLKHHVCLPPYLSALPRPAFRRYCVALLILLSFLSLTQNAKALTTQTYHYVNDGLSSGGNPTGLAGTYYLSSKAAYIPSGATNVTVSLSAWDTGGAGTDVYLALSTPTGYPSVFSGSINTSTCEQQYSLSVSIPAGYTTMGVYCDNPYYPSHSNNPYINVRNYRVKFSTSTTAPTVAFTAPTDGQAIVSWPGVTDAFGSTSGPGIEGTVSAQGGKAINSVRVYIRRYDGRYWDGSAWVACGVPGLTASYNPGTGHWTKVNGLPLNGDLLEGLYSVSVLAVDTGTQGTLQTIQITVDKTSPLVSSLTWPSDGQTVASLPYISGTAHDNSTGSGIDHVYIQITYEDSSPFLGWSGTSWVSGTFGNFLTTSLSGSNWTRSSGLPSGANLYNGHYTVRITAWDRAGNSSYAAQGFNIQKPSLIGTSGDKTPPTVRISSPTKNEIYVSATEAVGQATDDAPKAVRVYGSLYRYGSEDAQAGYWAGGNKWGATAAEGNASGSSSWRFKFPALASGKYAFRARALDSAGNSTLSDWIVFYVQ